TRTRTASARYRRPVARRSAIPSSPAARSMCLTASGYSRSTYTRVTASGSTAWTQARVAGRTNRAESWPTQTQDSRCARQRTGGRMWAAFARFEGGRVVHAIAAFNPADPDRAPDRPVWVVEICDSPLVPGSDSRTRQELLTLAGRNVVFCSNTGAVIAVDALS